MSTPIETPNPLLTMTAWQAVQQYGISMSSAQKWVEQARIAAGLPTRGELRAAARLERGPVGAAKGYRQIRLPKKVAQ